MKYVSTFVKYFIYKLSAVFTILRKVTKVSSSLSAVAIEYKQSRSRILEMKIVRQE